MRFILPGFDWLLHLGGWVRIPLQKLMTSFYFLMTTEGKVGSNVNRLCKLKVYSGSYGNLQWYRMIFARCRGSRFAEAARGL